MSKLVINTGSAANDGTGDTLRSGADKINSNFTEIYGALGPSTSLSVGFGQTVIGIAATNLNVGIATTNARSTFEVVGNIRAVSYSVGETQVVSSARQLQNIASLDATTTATIEAAVQATPNDFTSLSISGVSTFNGGINVNGGGDLTRLRVTGITTLGDSTTAQNVNISGVSTFTGITTNTSTLFTNQLSAAGISTFTNVLISSGSSLSVGSGTTITDGHLEVTGIITANGYIAGQGTNTIPAFRFTNGALLTGNGTVGAIEYDGQNFYATGVTTTGRGFVPLVNSFRLASNRQVIAATGQPGVATNFFDPGLIPLVANGVYEVDFDLYFTKGTTGVTTFTLSNASAPASISAILTSTPATGISTNSPAAPQLVTVVGGATTSTGLSLSLNAATHYTKISVYLENGNVNTNTLSLNIMNNNSTLTPLRGSRWKATLLSRNPGIGITQ